MPIVISAEVRTMSMIRKGTDGRKPISKARRSSLIMKAGITICGGASCHRFATDLAPR